jgi:hypothetical protein
LLKNSRREIEVHAQTTTKYHGEDPARLGSNDPLEAQVAQNAWNFCIRGGDHAYYWDETAPAIANELEVLIARA